MRGQALSCDRTGASKLSSSSDQAMEDVDEDAGTPLPPLPARFTSV